MTDPNSDTGDDLSRPHKTSRLRHLWVLGLGVYAAAIWYFGWRAMAAVLLSVDPRFLAGAMGVFAIVLWLRAYKWRYVLGPGSGAVGAYYLSKAAGAWTPGRVGELSPLLLPRYRNSRLGAWIVVDRLLEGGATIVIGVLGLLALQIPKRDLLWLMALAIILLVLLPGLLITRRDLFAALTGRCRRGSLLGRGLGFVTRVSGEVLLLRGKLAVATAITVLATCLDVVANMVFWRAFAAPFSFALLATVQCVSGITSALPLTPDVSGVPYVVAGTMLHTVGGIAPEVYAAGIGVLLVVINIVFWFSFAVAAAKGTR